MISLLIQATLICCIACFLLVGNLVGLGEIFPSLFNGSWISMAAGLAVIVALIAIDILCLALVVKFISKKLKKGIDNAKG